MVKRVYRNQVYDCCQICDNYLLPPEISERIQINRLDNTVKPLLCRINYSVKCRESQRKKQEQISTSTNTNKSQVMAFALGTDSPLKVNFW